MTDQDQPLKKYSFLERKAGVGRTQVARCSPDVAALYDRKEGVAEAPAVAENDRRALVFDLVRNELGTGDRGIRCERYLLDAAYRWLLASCASQPSAITYVRRFRAWCDETARRALSGQTSARPDDVRDFLFGLEARGLAPRTIIGHRDVLRSWFSWLMARELIARSPITLDVRRMFRVDPAAVRKADGTRQAFTLEQGRAVVAWALTTARPVVGAGVLLMIGAGLRSAEVAGALRRGMVAVHAPGEPEAFKLTLRGKGNRQRTVLLEPVVVQALQRYLQADRRQGDRGALLRAPGGGHYTPASVQAWAKDAARHVGRPEISSHDFRKTCATLLMEAGATLEECQKHLGHSNPVLTARCYVVRRPAMTARTGLGDQTKEPAHG